MPANVYQNDGRVMLEPSPSRGQTWDMPPVAAASTVPDYRRRALIALSAAMVAWGITGVAAKSVDMGGMALAAYRSTVGAVALVTVLYATGRRLSWRKLRLGLAGGIFLGLDLTLFFSAVKLTTVANATVIG